jgi:hypothetical protein
MFSSTLPATAPPIQSATGCVVEITTGRSSQSSYRSLAVSRNKFFPNDDSPASTISSLPPLHDVVKRSQNLLLFNRNFFDQGKTTLTLLNLDTLEWGALPPPKFIPYLCGAAVSDFRLFIVGGWHLGEYHGSVLVFNLTTLKWSKLQTAMRVPRDACAVVVRDDNKLIVVGGYSAVAGGELASVEMCDLTSTKWTELPSLSRPRTGCGVVCTGDKLITLGGCCRAPQLDFLACGEIFSFTTNIWSPFPFPMIHARTCFGFVMHNSKLFVIGGWNGHGQVEARNICGEFLDLNSTDPTWQQLPSVPLKPSTWSSFSGCSATVHTNKIFVCFGEQLTVYDIESGQWTDLCFHAEWISKPACFIVS